jgi:biotin carboxylase
VLVEQYVTGPEVSVETFGSQVVGVTAKHLGPLPDFVEAGHDFPADGQEAAAATALRAVEALGLAWGPAHTEVRLAPGGAAGRGGPSSEGAGSPVSPVVIEVNPRLAGGEIPVLVRLATGVDLVGATVDLATSAVPAVRRRPDRPGSYASIRFLLPPSGGRVRAVTGLDRAAAVPGVVDAVVSVAPGEMLRRTGSFLDRVGYVIAAAPTPGDARAAAEQALAQVGLDLGASSEHHREPALTGRALS